MASVTYGGAMVSEPMPLRPPPRADAVERLDGVLKAHPGWTVRYDGMRDLIVFTSPDGMREIARYRLGPALDELEQE